MQGVWGMTGSGHNKAEQQKTRMLKWGFTYIAFWQIAAFILLLLLIWANEVLDIPNLVFEVPSAAPNLTRACISSAGVLVAAIITVGHTYLQQRHLIYGILTICSYCHKVRISQEDWERLEVYFGRRTLAAFSHGVCPDCLAKAHNEIESGKPSGTQGAPACKTCRIPPYNGEPVCLDSGTGDHPSC